MLLRTTQCTRISLDLRRENPQNPLLATVNKIEKGFHKKEFVVVTLLDIRGAFDNIKPSAIIKAMRKQGV
jgi:hypothetical protein